jgi:signal peptidase
MLKRLGTIFQGLMAAVVIAFVLVMASSFLPLPNTIKLFTVRSGSMEPAIETGSLIFVYARPTYAVGDIVTVATSDKQSVTHRIIERRETGTGPVYQTQGDANEEPDPVTVTQKEIVGKTLLDIPYLGYPVAYAQTKAGFLWLIVLPAALIILSEFVSIVSEVRRLARQKKSLASPQAVPQVRNVNFAETAFAGPTPSRRLFTPPPAPVRRRKIV